MRTKALSACSVLAVLAFLFIPAYATASPLLQTSAGVVVPVGTAVKAQNVGNIRWTTELSVVECANSEITGKVVTNSGTKIEITVETLTFKGTAVSERCTASTGETWKPTASTHWCLVSTVLGSWSLRGGSCGGKPVALNLTKDIYNFTGDFLGECKYERTEMTGTNNTGASPLELTTSANQTFTRTFLGTLSQLCPEKENLDLRYKLQTSTGEDLKVI
ncbi:MAG: hypothetical protein ACTHKT_01190 [Solirubrobacterales bacterium]